MSSATYTTTNWQDYPNTTTPITAAQLNRIESHTVRAPKETATFLLNAVTGGLKAVQSVPIMSTTVGTTINDYNPQNGDKLVVWKSNAIPCVENTDYTVTEEDGVYKIKAIGQAIVANLQIWNIPTGATAQTYGSAYTNISSLITDSISGTATQGE